MSRRSAGENRSDLIERLRAILASRNLTMSEVSSYSKSLYTSRPEAFIPHNFYYNLRNSTFTPSIYQVHAFSRISRYLMGDWLRLFGFDPEVVTRLQILLPSRRTVLLDTSLMNRRAPIPTLLDRFPNQSFPQIAPLPQLLQIGCGHEGHPWPRPADGEILYVKLGQRDTVCFPELIPGSIVRISAGFEDSLLPRMPGEVSERIFLIEQGNCLRCCPLRRVSDCRLVPAAIHEPYMDVGWAFEARSSIRGVADLEIQPRFDMSAPGAPASETDCWTPNPLLSGLRVSRVLRAARRKLELSFRDASSISRQVARMMNDAAYFLSVSSLSDYEASDTLPRHLQKVFAVCVLYGLTLPALLQAAGISLNSAGEEPLPEELLPSRIAKDGCGCEKINRPHDDAGLAAYLSRTLGELPFLLRGSLGSISGLASPALRDFFWVGAESGAAHPYLRNALLLIVNRHRKTPQFEPANSLWQQRLYLLRMRDGRYVCACCGLQDRNLILHSYVDHLHLWETLRNQQDAEVVGQVVTIVRRLE